MKRFILLFCLALSTITMSAQTYWDNSRPDHRLTFGVRAGVNFSKTIEKELDMSYCFGYQGGVALDINIIQSLSIGTGLTYIRKGYKMELEFAKDYVIKYTTHVGYIEMPLFLSYRVKLSDSSRFQFNGGTYFAYGIESNNNSYFAKNRGRKRFDAGLLLGIAVTYNQFLAGVNYERGLYNINKTGDKMNNGCIAISLGYNF